MTEPLQDPFAGDEPWEPRDGDAPAKAATSNVTPITRKKGAPEISWRGTEDIFAPLPEAPWQVCELQIGPGRPTMFAGFGYSKKTLSLQSLALSLAAGGLVWGRYAVSQSEVRHLDFEQGWSATARRYQRLAKGHAIERESLGDRLKLSVFPPVFLDSPKAVDAYSSACEGAGLVILDALRGAAPKQDENDSAIRSCIDNLTRVSELTGAAFVLVHHAGKPKDGHSDARTIARGSSAIFDACGCVLMLGAGKEKGSPSTVRQVKTPAEAQGGAIDDFELYVEDVAIGADPAAGVRVVHRDVKAAKPTERAAKAYDERADLLLEAIRANPGASQNVLLQKCGMNRNTASQTLRALEDEGRVRVFEGDRGAKTYRVEVAR